MAEASERYCGRGHRETQLPLANLGINYGQLARIDEALPVLKDAPGNDAEAEFKVRLLSKAEPLMVQGVRRDETARIDYSTSGRKRDPRGPRRLVELYTAAGKTDEVTRYRKLRNQSPQPD